MYAMDIISTEISCKSCVYFKYCYIIYRTHLKKLDYGLCTQARTIKKLRLKNDVCKRWKAGQEQQPQLDELLYEIQQTIQRLHELSTLITQLKFLYNET